LEHLQKQKASQIPDLAGLCWSACQEQGSLQCNLKIYLIETIFGLKESNIREVS
jgi:hypothetical protein